MSVDYVKRPKPQPDDPVFRPPVDDRQTELRDATRAFLAADRAVQEGEASNANGMRKRTDLRPLYSRRLALARALAYTAERLTG